MQAKFVCPTARVLTGILLLVLSASVAESRRTRATPAEVTQLNRKQAVALHHAVKKLLGFKETPRKLEEGARGHLDSGHLGRKSNSLLAPPQYMLDLYDKYKYGAIAHGRLTGNTARYINAEIGLVNGERMFLFNLTSVARTERVFSAEVHVHQRRTKSKHTENFMRLHKVAPPILTDVGNVQLRSRGNGWTVNDVTSAIKKCISTNREADLLAVSFRRKKKGKKSRAIPLSRFSDAVTMPFLVLFSNDTQNITLDHVDPHFRAADLMEDIIDPEFGYDPTLVNGKYRAKSIPDDEGFSDYDEDYSDEEEDMGDSDGGVNGEDDILSDFDGFDGFKGFGEEDKNNEDEDSEEEEEDTDPTSDLPVVPTPTSISADALDRHRRSIIDNEIPEDPVQDLKVKLPFNVPLPDAGGFPGNHGTHKPPTDTHHHKANGKSKGKGKNKFKPTRDGDDLEVQPHKKHRPTVNQKHKLVNPDDADDLDDADLIPFPDEFIDRRRKNRRRNNRRRNRKHRRRRPHDQERQLPLPPEWEAEMRKENAKRRGDPSGLCGRRKLVVDFADIAWDDWVISPKSFDAYYCAGQCPFPLTKDVRPSNHATIQSLVHAIGLPAGVPAPCCVPDELSSVSLLYFDGNDNVVLKHYPSMSVLSCACR